MPLTAAQQAECEEFIPLARAQAWRIFQRAPHALDFQDLIGIAQYAIVEAVERWPRYCAGRGADPDSPESRNYLVAYVKMRVDGALLDHQRSADWVTRTERTMIKKLRQSEQELGRDSTLPEQAAHAGVDLARARAALASHERRPGWLEDEIAASERIADERADADGQAFVTSVLDRVADTIEALDETSRLVIIFKYYEHMTMTDIATALGIDLGECRKRWEAGIQVAYGVMLRAAVDTGACSCGGACSCVA